MGRKLRHLLIFLLIILKGPDMPEAGGSCARNECQCSNQGLMITSIHKKLPPAIDQLFYKDNQIFSIRPGLFSNLSKLQCLDLSANFKIYRIKNGTFSDLPKLTDLCLHRNKILSIQVGTFSDLPKPIYPTYLPLSRNKICSIPRGTFSDLNLCLSSNRITSIQVGTFTNLLQLKYLNLNKNGIRILEVGTFSDLPQLETLDLSKNRIESIQHGTVSDLTQLTCLYLYHNSITSIQVGAFSNLPKLQHVSLNNNNICSIQLGTFSNLPNLVSLHLFSNSITRIQVGTFSNLPKLTILNLRSNSITRIQVDAFSNLTKLEHLDLHSNWLSTLPLSDHDIFTSIPKLFIDKNPWQCDCKMAPLRQQMIESPSVLRQITCARPDNLSGQKLQYVSPEDLVCKGLTKSTPAVDALNLFSSSAVSTSTGDMEWEGFTNVTMGPLPPTLAANGTIHESGPSSPLTVVILSVLGAVVTLTAAIILIIWSKRRMRNTDLALHKKNTTAITNQYANDNTNTTANSGHDHQYEDVDKQHNQTGHSQAITKPNTNTTAAVVTKAITESYTNNTPAVKVSGTGPVQTVYQAITESLDTSNPSYNTVPTASNSKLDSLYKDVGQYQAIGKSNKNTSTASLTSGHDQTGQGQSQAITESNTNTTAAVTSGNGQIGQGQCQANTQSLKVGNLSHDQVLPTLQPNTTYVEVGTPPKGPTSAEISSGHDQTGQGQSLANTQSLIVGNLSHDQVIAALQPNTMYVDVGTPPKGPTSAEISSGQDKTGQGQSQANTQSLIVGNLSQNEVLAALQPNTMYVDVGTPWKGPTSAEISSGHDQTGQGQS
ncbi:leucine-rich repeat-containing protein 15-like [Branchiostoma lanceolatum]|uniref:leucine-rich repeat-containing protein 15-like n=1 Tax=Branchiostoma lanceolatum TaxID=7740 RepID=UPI003453257D